jgi:hypothetical protein
VAYHADLTTAFGVQFVWRGRVTSITGQGVPRRLAGIWSARHPIRSTVTLAKEAAKGAWARAGNEKYRMHAANDVLRRTRLRDGRPVWEFLRSNPHWGGVSRSETADGLPEVLTQAMLDRLIEREAVCVLYTHLGKIGNRAEPLRPAAREALARLARYCANGEILVTTTRRLLGYCCARRNLEVETTTHSGDGLTLSIRAPDARADLDGLTFYVAKPARTRLTVNGEEIVPVRNPVDHIGMASVSIPWRRIEFPSL